MKNWHTYTEGSIGGVPARWWQGETEIEVEFQRVQTYYLSHRDQDGKPYVTKHEGKSTWRSSDVKEIEEFLGDALVSESISYNNARNLQTLENDESEQERALSEREANARALKNGPSEKPWRFWPESRTEEPRDRLKEWLERRETARKGQNPKKNVAEVAKASFRGVDTRHKV